MACRYGGPPGALQFLDQSAVSAAILSLHVRLPCPARTLSSSLHSKPAGRSLRQSRASSSWRPDRRVGPLPRVRLEPAGANASGRLATGCGPWGVINTATQVGFQGDSNSRTGSAGAFAAALGTTGQALVAFRDLEHDPARLGVGHLARDRPRLRSQRPPPGRIISVRRHPGCFPHHPCDVTIGNVAGPVMFPRRSGSPTLPDDRRRARPVTSSSPTNAA